MSATAISTRACYSIFMQVQRSRWRRELHVFNLFMLGLAGACASEPEPEQKLEAETRGAASTRRPTGDFMTGEVMVELDHELPAGKLVIAGRSLTPIGRTPAGVWRMRIDDMTSRSGLDLATAEAMTFDAIDALRVTPGVVRAYENITLELSAIPSDPLYNPHQLWNYQAVKLPAAWNRSVGAPGVRLAIIDSGSINHPDLITKWGQGYDFNGTGDEDPTDLGTYHHGAHVASIAGGATNNGIGGAGVCWNCTLLAYRTDANLSGPLSQIEAAIYRAGPNPFFPSVTGADVINISMNRSTRSCTEPATEDLRLAIQTVVAAGVPVVVSAGNFSSSGGPAFPADCPGVISVGAIQPNGTIAQYSNRGGTLDLVAPGGGGNGNTQYGAPVGTPLCPPSLPPPAPQDPYTGTVGVVAAWAHYLPGDQLGLGDHCYRHLSGTSMAAPHVTGVVGLMKSRASWLSGAQVEDILVRTAQRNTPCPPGVCGAGLLDADNAVRYATYGGVPIATMTAPTFPAVPAGDSAIANATVNNTGSAALTLGTATPILRIDGGGGQIEFGFPSGDCTAGVTCNRALPAIAAGGSLAIPLRCRPAAAGTINAQLVINSDGLSPGGPATVVPVSCTAAIAPPEVTVTPTFVSFADQPINTVSPPQPVTVRNDGGGTLSFTASDNSPHFTVGCSAGCTCAAGTCSGALLAGQSATLAAYFAPAVNGERLASLEINANDADEPSTSVLLIGRATVAQLEILPNPLHAGAVSVGSSGFADGSLRNSNEAPLHITHLSLDQSGTAFTLAGPCDGQTECNFAATLPAGTAIPIRIRCTPTAHGPTSAQLIVLSNATGSPSSRTVACQGLAPSFVVSLVPGLSFGSVVVGASATSQIFINNATANEGSVSSWSVNRPSSPYSLTCTSGCTCTATTCSGGNSATMQLAFTPPSFGSHPAQLTFATNDPQRPSPSYGASGMGVPAVTVVTPTGKYLDLSSSPGWPSAPGTVTIRNDGPSAIPLTPFTLSGANQEAFSVSGPKSASLPAGQSASWQVTCTPTWFHGTGTATLDLHHGALGSPASIDLRCAVLELTEPVDPPVEDPPVRE